MGRAGVVKCNSKNKSKGKGRSYASLQDDNVFHDNDVFQDDNAKRCEGDLVFA